MNLMLRHRAYSCSIALAPLWRCSNGVRFITTSKSSDPLRVLFCGADEFSAASLRSLASLQKQEPDIVHSIDVVCRTGKPHGRGLKTIREVPIKHVAEQLGLPVHEIPTFQGWQPPRPHGQPINLVIAVSFGLLVPPRILDGAKYGGLNLHPSLLPALRGPAPLHHTLILDLQRSGITLQTMHPRHFDRGSILSYEYVTLSDSDTRNLSTLQQMMAPKAADLLIAGIRSRLFVPPIKPEGPPPNIEESQARKLDQNDSHIDWTTWDSDRIIRTQKALAPLWNVWRSCTGNMDHKDLRVQWHGLRVEKLGKSPNDVQHLVGIPSVQLATDTNAVLERGDDASSQTRARIGGIVTIDGKFLVPEAVTIAGGKSRQPHESLRIVERLWKLAASQTQSLK